MGQYIFLDETYVFMFMRLIGSGIHILLQNMSGDIIVLYELDPTPLDEVPEDFLFYSHAYFF